MAPTITSQDYRSENGEPEHTLSYTAAHASTRILELENRCTRKRTVGSNPTLSANIRWFSNCLFKPWLFSVLDRLRGVR
jgi:hypothetical protein